MVAVENADAEGARDDRTMRGDRRVVQARRDLANGDSRRRAAVQAALDKIKPVSARAPVDPAVLRQEREAVAARGGIVQKTAAKVATDEHTWQQYVEEQGVEIESYPSEDQVVEFAVWMTNRRERVCLAQRPEAGTRLKGLVKRTIRNMLTELFAHAWPRNWPAFAALERKERSAYEEAVLKQVDGLHKQAACPAVNSAGGGASAEERDRAQQLTAQTAPVTERKHFYRTEVHQIQDDQLAEEKDVTGAIALGAADALMQTTAARCGMFSKDA